MKHLRTGRQRILPIPPKLTCCLATGLLLVAALAGCTRPHETEDERIRRQAAQDTRQLREDARTAGTMARQEALKARQQARDIVAGVREGWKDGAPTASSSGRKSQLLDVNTASIAQLSKLPGVSHLTASRIAHRRPYAETDDLVKGRLLTEEQYRRIADRLTVGHPSDQGSPGATN